MIKITIFCILKKNVIVILIDGGRLDWAKKSNFFQSLDSVFFSQTITYAPYTTSAMHAFISGTFGNRNGANSYWNVYEFKKNKFKTLSSYLQENDYKTYSDCHSELILPKIGFDNFAVYDEKNTDLLSRHSRLLNDMKKIQNNGENFFLYLHYSPIHTGIMEEVLKVYDNFSKEFFDNPQVAKDRYHRLFDDAEYYLQNMLDEIKKLQLLDNSIILISADHGVSIGEKFGEKAYGAFCYDYTIRTFAYLLANELPKLEIKQQIRHVDFLPTILDFLNIPIDTSYETIDGQSLLPLIKGESVEEKIAFTETGNPLKSNKPPKLPNTKSIRTSQWKLIINEYNDTKELYNLIKDPDEKTNLIEQNLPIEKELFNEFLKIQDFNK
ncbi:MAG: hypothetical protein CL712_00240 [Chloroflexi bacterium]|nr:hypothetical protein [Chloroflexota bacterium]